VEQKDLCETCRNIPRHILDFDADNYKHIDLDSANEIATRTTCALCRLLTHALSFNTQSNTATLLPPSNAGEAKVTLTNGNGYLGVQDHKGRHGRIARVSLTQFEYTPNPLYTWPRPKYEEYGFENRSVPVRNESESRYGKYHKAINREGLDFDQIGAWLLACETIHERCSYLALLETKEPINLTLIDVVTRNLVSATSAERCIALSYVWGKGKKFTAESGNIDELRKPNFLREENDIIPLTLRDAMNLVQKIGERYLWVDSLCIIQDDPRSRDQIYSMDHIYANGLFTIVALSAPDANAGLAGVRHGTRQLFSLVERVHGQDLVTVFPDVWDTFNSSTYITRGWTFQEHLLSKRQLYITSHQAYWECSEDLRAEDIVGTRSFDSKLNPIKDLLERGEADLITWFGFYESMVQNYTKRLLSNQYDIFEAFAGVASRLGPWCNQRMAAGIPLGPLFRALFFIPLSPNFPEARRRRCLPNRNFPTWSWLAWSGPITYAFGMIDKNRDQFVLKGLIRSIRLMAIGADTFFPVVPHDPSGTFHERLDNACDTERWAAEHVSKAWVRNVNEVADMGEDHVQRTQGQWDADAFFKLKRPICLSFIAPFIALDYYMLGRSFSVSLESDQSPVAMTPLSEPSGPRCGIICNAPSRDALAGMSQSGEELILVGICFSRMWSLRGESPQGLMGTDSEVVLSQEGDDAHEPSKASSKTATRDGWCGCIVDFILVTRNTETNMSERLAIGKMHSDAWWRTSVQRDRFNLV
jgi:hypothetical protein